jgi:hypothetical protein
VLFGRGDRVPGKLSGGVLRHRRKRNRYGDKMSVLTN